MKKAIFFALLCGILLCGITICAQEYKVLYTDAAYTGTWTQNTQYCDETTSGSKYATAAGTATFYLPEEAPAGNYKIYYFVAHSNTGGMDILINGESADFRLSCYGFASGAVNQYIGLMGDKTYALKGDGTDTVVINAKGGGYARATSIKFVYVDNETHETHQVSNANAVYSGTWTTSASIYGDETGIASQTSSETGATAFFALPQTASAGRYAVYYFLPHTTTNFGATIGETSVTFTVGAYGYNGSAQVVRQWVRLGGDGAVYDLTPGQGVTLTRNNGYTRATSIKFVRMGDISKRDFARIGITDDGFTKSDGWTNATMPDSAGNAASLYTASQNQFAQYTPANLEAGWYDVSFWNIKYQNHQNPVKMTATVSSGGKVLQNIPLPVNTVSADRGGIWSPIGTYYFNGTNDEFVKLITTGGDFARVADVKFEKNNTYVPDYTDLADGLTVAAAPNIKLYSTGGVYNIYGNGTLQGQIRVRTENSLLFTQRVSANNEKQLLCTIQMPKDRFVYVTLDGVANGNISFENVTDKKHVLFSLTDNLMSDAPCNFLSAGSFTAHANIYNPNGNNAWLLIGVYENNKPIQPIKSQKISLTDGKGEAFVSFDLLNVTENTRVKAFIWDNQMQPLYAPYLFYPHQNEAPYLISATDFSTLGNWTKAAQSAALFNTVLQGASDSQNHSDTPAVFTLNVNHAGTYKLWVRSNHVVGEAGKRSFRIAVNGTENSVLFGNLNQDGYHWEDGGTVTLTAGENIISVLDTSGYYARLDSLILTPDINYIPNENVKTEVNKVSYPSMSMQETDFMRNFAVTRDFSGGNVLVDGMKEDVVYIRPDLSDTETNWFYWNFKTTSDIDRSVTFKLLGNNYIISASGVAYSYDGENWQYLSESAFKTEFTFDLKAGQEVQLSCTIPYVYSDLTAFLNTLPESSVSTLCLSEDGLEVPMITLGTGEQAVVFTARHHSCEATPSYLIEGLVNYLLNSADAGLLSQYTFYIVPMMDVDGVEKGEQGKQRIPHDHNRDYEAQMYASVRALVNFTANKNVAAFMDFHCPGLQDAKPYFYYDSTRDQEVVMAFANTLKDVLAADTTPNKIMYDGTKDYDDLQFKAASKGYFYLEKGAPLSTTLEFPYTDRVGDEYTKERMRHFGENVAKAFEIYLTN